MERLPGPGQIQTRATLVLRIPVAYARPKWSTLRTPCTESGQSGNFMRCPAVAFGGRSTVPMVAWVLLGPGEFITG